MRLINYIKDVLRETGNIKWLKIELCVKYTILIVVFGVIIGFLLGGLDFGTSYLLREVI